MHRSQPERSIRAGLATPIAISTSDLTDIWDLVQDVWPKHTVSLLKHSPLLLSSTGITSPPMLCHKGTLVELRDSRRYALYELDKYLQLWRHAEARGIDHVEFD